MQVQAQRLTPSVEFSTHNQQNGIEFMASVEMQAFRSLHRTQTMINKTIVGLLIDNGISAEAVVERFHAAADVVESHGDLPSAMFVRDIAKFVEARRPELANRRKPS
jgi:hypothetical protein